MRYTHCWPWIMMKKLKNVENETQTLQDLEYGKKILKNLENENCTSVGPGVWQEN